MLDACLGKDGGGGVRESPWKTNLGHWAATAFDLLGRFRFCFRLFFRLSQQVQLRTSTVLPSTLFASFTASVLFLFSSIVFFRDRVFLMSIKQLPITLPFVFGLSSGTLCVWTFVQTVLFLKTT
jgi:hypothetical protein